MYFLPLSHYRKNGAGMRLSIIVPFDRGVHFLEDCFASIRDQGISDFETILVLDHTTEDVTGILKEYSDLNIKTVELQEKRIENRNYSGEDIGKILKGRSGAGAARNAGLNAAEGEYVYFLDSDDYILSGTLPYLLKEIFEQQADFAYGKKATTWFRRKVYLASIEEHKEEVIKEDQDIEADKDKQVMFKLRYTDPDMVEEEVVKTFPHLDKARQKQMAQAYYNLFVSRKGLLNVSVLGLMINRNFIEQHKLRFDENFVFYSDLGFLMRVINLAETSSMVEEAVYVKRSHNDPINYPSLTQIKTENRFEEYMESYDQARGLIRDNHVLLNYLDHKFINAFARTYARNVCRDRNKLWRTKRFTMMHEAIKKVDSYIIRSLKGYKKRITKALLSGNIKRLKFHVNFHLGIHKIRKIRKKWRVLSYYLYEHYFIKMPVKDNWVICESFFAKSYSDSPKYIYEYLCKNYPGKYKFIWAVNKKTKIPFNPVKVKRFSIRYAYYLARCKYNVFNVRQPEWVIKREGNVFLQTWHGTPLKKLVFDQEEVMAASPLYKAQFYKQSRIWDYLISANHFSTRAFRSAFLYDKEMLEYGYPRNDLMYHPEKDRIAADIKRKLDIPEGKKTILYAPTWRDDEYYGRGEYKFTLKLNLRLLQQELGNDYVVLLRTHYFIADNLDITGVEDFVINVCKYDDITELYLVSDILITDYSSVFFDYANLRRPILFYTYDLDKYRDMLRGFYLDIEQDMPGPLLFTDEEVVAAVKNIDSISGEYKDKYDEFYEKYCSLENGHAAEMVAKKVFGLEQI